MTDRKNIQIAFHRAQRHLAENLVRNLSPAGYNFDLLLAGEGESLQAKIDPNRKLIWIISDNYLKSTSAMVGAIETLFETRKGDKLLALISPGLYPDNDSDAIKEVETRFQRMGDVIPYMNFWQTEYLDMRKWKRNLPEEDQAAFEVKLQDVKAISTTIGEFLQELRKTNHHNWADFTQRNYEAFFQFVNDPNGMSKLPAEDERELAELIHASSEDILRENEILAEDKPVSIEEIPGMDLLSKASNVITELEDQEEETEPVPQPAEPVAEAERETDNAEDEKEEELEEVQQEEEEEDDDEDEDDDTGWAEGQDEATRMVLAGQVDEGISAFRNIISSYESATEPKYRLGLILLEHKNEVDQASTLFSEVLNQDPGHSGSNFILGEIAEYKKDYNKARDFYEKTYDLDKGYPDINYRLGMLYAVQFPDEPGLTEHFLKKAVKQNKERPDAQYQLALLYSERLFRKGKAKKHFKKTLKYQQNHPFANYDLALIYHQEGNYEKASEYYQRAIQINPELKTPDNDVAFQVVKQVVPETVSEASPEVDSLVMITGATAGIGKATAELLASKGFRLILTGRRIDRLEELKSELEEQYGEDRIEVIEFDVRDYSSSEQAINSLQAPWSEIDVLINNAGLAMGLAPIHEGDPNHWDTMIDTNIKGLLYMTRLVAPGMVERKSGQIINVCSTAGKESYPMGNVYVATKHAVDALTRSMRLDLFKHGIRVGQVSPGHVEETEFALVRFEGDAQRARIYDDFHPLTSKDVAEAIFFMISRPAHVNIQDVLMMGKQQASNNFIDRSGRTEDAD